MKIMFVVTHLLGTGHLTRIMTLAKGFVQAGHTALVVSGGMPVPRLVDSTVDLVQLPPLRSDGTDFSRLLDDRGALASADLMAERQRLLVETCAGFQPDALVTELFPFGRRSLRIEFLALLTAARLTENRPTIFASIRDILAPPGKPAKVDFADQTIAQFYDAVLVHSDAAITPLDLSWPVSAALRAKLQYTGFVAPPPPDHHPDHLGRGEILVSAGGGDVGDDLFLCARAAAALDPARVWRILVGGQDAGSKADALQRAATGNLIVEAARPDFRQMLHHAAASVSFCGYNTALDLLQTACPAVFVPFDAGQEVEQVIRARALERQPGFAVLDTAALSPAALLDAVNAVIAAPSRQPTDTSGVARTVETVGKLTRADHAY